MANEIKVQSGQDRVLWWLAPKPLVQGSTPDILLKHAGVANATPTLVPIAAEGEVIAIDQYQTELTLSAPIAKSGGVNGSFGEAFLITAEDGYFPVRVKRLDGTQVLLAETTTTLPSITTNARLQFRRWHTLLIVADVTGTPRRDWVSEVSYVAQGGTDIPSSKHTDRHLLHVVLQPFDPKLTHEGLIEYFPDMSQLPMGRQQSFQPQIDRAMVRLVSDIRVELRNNACSKFEDDVEAGTLQSSFAHLVASLVYTIRDAELSGILEKTYKVLLAEELQAVWLDCNGDGVVDPGENPQATATMVDTSAYFASNPPNRLFGREDIH